MEDIQFVLEGRYEGVDDNSFENGLTIISFRRVQEVLLALKHILGYIHEEVNSILEKMLKDTLTIFGLFGINFFIFTNV